MFFLKTLLKKNKNLLVGVRAVARNRFFNIFIVRRLAMKSRYLGILTVLFAFVVMTLPAHAGKKPLVPASLKGVKIISLSDMNSMVKNKKIGKSVIVYDSRKTSDYEAGRIPGATHMAVPGKPDLGSAEIQKAIDAMSAKITPDKNMQIIFYCNGDHCWRSPKSAAAAVKMGYTKVGWLRDGFPNYRKKGYPVE